MPYLGKQKMFCVSATPGKDCKDTVFLDVIVLDLVLHTTYIYIYVYTYIYYIYIYICITYVSKTYHVHKSTFTSKFPNPGYLPRCFVSFLSPCFEASTATSWWKLVPLIAIVRTLAVYRCWVSLFIAGIT